jgi:hypothetical protein
MLLFLGKRADILQDVRAGVTTSAARMAASLRFGAIMG